MVERRSDNVVESKEINIRLRDCQIKQYGKPSATNDRLRSGSAGGTIGTTILNDLFEKPSLERAKRERTQYAKSRDSLKKVIE